ncbi:MAG: DUF2288 domain-containing protein [Gammaproteobacteria bacterium]|nr:MAG: DUF2288 domain-containing protein [Gammaproteobacteria bacterium]
MNDSPDTPNPDDPDLLRAKLNTDTARIRWHELQRYWARGQVVRVHSRLNLIDVGLALRADDKALFERWMRAGDVGPVTDDQARQWVESDPELWALVIAPWVLVQYRPLH